MSINSILSLLLFLLIRTAAFGQIDNAIVDLQDYDSQNGQTLYLKGTWLFSPDSFLDGTTIIDSAQLMTIDVPKRWDQVGINTKGYGTYLLTIINKPETPLSIKLPDVLSAYKFFINGQFISEAGKVGVDVSSTIPKRRVDYISIPSDLGDTLRLYLQIANFSHARGGLGSIPILGSKESIMKNKLYEDTYDVFLFGCLFMGGLFFLGLYASGRKEKMAVYFALFCFVYAYRVIGWGNYLLHDLVEMPYNLGLKLEYGTLYLSVFFFAKYLKKLFPKEAPKRLINFFAYSALLWTATIFLPTDIFTGLVNYFLWILLGVMILVGAIFIKAALNKRHGANLAIYSTFGIFLVFILKTLIFFRIITDILFLNLIGELSFFFFQSLILSKYFITDWREAKIEAEKLASSKADFLSVMSHEIRTPLNALIGTTYHMLDSKPRLDQKKDLFNLKNASENLLNLVNNILDFNKIEQNKLELELDDVHFEEYVQNQVYVFDSMAEVKKIFLKLNYDKQLPKYVRMDKGRVGQILSNLIGNAIKFTEKGGVIVNVKSEGKSRDCINIKFDIIDTGIGIEEQEREKIFESFEQANAKIAGNYGGTGLGLAISKRLLERMDSNIEVKSIEGQGSLFSFSLCLKSVNPKAQTQTKLAKRNLQGCRLLLVEDNTMNVMIAQRFLKKWNVDITVAENGQKAVDLVFNKEAYDIVLMDLQMPVLNGYQAATAMRKSGFLKPILAVTASAITETDLKENGGFMQDYVTKPYKPEDLYNKIEKYWKLSKYKEFPIS